MLYSREKQKIKIHNERPHTSRILHGDREKNRHDNNINNILYHVRRVYVGYCTTTESRRKYERKKTVYKI